MAVREETAALHAALAALAPAQRQMLGLAFFRGATHEEIAAHGGLPLGTVKSQIRRALAALKRVLDTTGSDIMTAKAKSPRAPAALPSSLAVRLAAAMAPTDVPPARLAAMRDKLLARVREEAPRFVTVRSADGEWVALGTERRLQDPAR